MRTPFTKAALVALAVGLLAAISSARALVVAPPPGPNRVAQAGAVIHGRVIGMEPQDVELAQFPNQPKTAYRVAVVTVLENVVGAKEEKMVRLAFMPPPEKNPNAGLILPRPGIRNVVPTVGLEGLFFLTKHPTEKVYFAPMYYDVVARTPENDANFQKELAGAKKAAKVLEDPLASLKGDNAEDRFLAASLLLARYRNPRNFSNKTTPIPAEESKLILKTILEGNWNQPRVFGQQGPYELFNQLGLSAKEGWQPKAKTIQELQKQAQTWLQGNVDSYRIQQFTAEPKADSNPVKPNPIKPKVKLKPA